MLRIFVIVSRLEDHPADMHIAIAAPLGVGEKVGAGLAEGRQRG